LARLPLFKEADTMPSDSASLILAYETATKQLTKNIEKLVDKTNLALAELYLEIKKTRKRKRLCGRFDIGAPAQKRQAGGRKQKS
jgi:hypothetical protein